MTKLKKINLAFLIVLIVVLAAGIVHTAVLYGKYLYAASQWLTGAPAEVAFFMLIPYAFGALLWGIVWIGVYFGVRRKIRKGEVHDVRGEAV